MFANTVGAKSAQRAPAGMAASMRLLGCAAAVVAMLLVGSASARAESLCTDTWTGPAEGNWRTASYWSSGKAPTSTDVACLGSSTNVWVSEEASAGVVQDQGRLDVETKSFEITNALEASSVKTLHVSGGSTVLTGAANLDITGALVWESGIIAGSGQTVLLSGASATLSGGNLDLSEHTFVNEGTMTLSNGEIIMFGAAAQIVNKATLKLSDEYGIGNGGKTGPTIVNEGLIEKPTGAWTTKVAPSITNAGTVEVLAGYLEFRGGGTSSGSSAKWLGSEAGTLIFGGEQKPKYTLDDGTASGKINISCAESSVEGLNASNAQLDLDCASVMTIPKGTLTVGRFAMEDGYLYGPGSVITKTFVCKSQSYLSASTSLTIQAKGTGEVNIGGGNLVVLNHSIFKNEGTFTWTSGGIITQEYAKIVNNNRFLLNGGEMSAEGEQEKPDTRFINRDVIERTATGESEIYPLFENYGRVIVASGKIRFRHPVSVDRKTKYGKHNKSALSALGANCGDPVNCLTGNFYESQADVGVGGRGVGLGVTRTYNAQAAAAGEHGAFGYGWTISFGEHLTFNSEAHTVTLVQEEGSTVTFTEEGGKLVAPEWTQDELTGSKEAGYTLTMSDRTVYKFSGSGLLESVTDRNGNATSVGYNEKGELATITGPAGRTIKLAYDAEGLVESATDPMGYVVKYAYESGNLVSVTMPGESSPRWRFKYDASHRITSMTNGLGGETKNTYNSESQVTAQTEPSGTVMKWEYEPFVTKVTNEATGSVTLDEYTSEYQLAAITHGYGTEHATTESWTYNERGEPLTRTDGKGNVTGYEYDAAGDKIAETDPEGHEAKWSYNSHHQVTSETNPSGESTSIEYDEHGNAVKVLRPAPEEKTQVTQYEYNADGEMTAMIDPLEDKWSYGYDEAGDRTSETSPEGDKTTWGYNEDGQQTSEVAPAGNVEGGKPAEYTTSTERDAQGLPVKVTQPEGQETLFEYNAEGAQTAVTDPNGHKTSTSYNSEDLPVKVTQASGATQETEYNGAGQVIAQIDGNKHATKYVRNVLGQVTEIVNPLEQKTKETYDADGNLASLTDPMGRTTTYTYNKQDQPTKIAYSEEATPTVEYEYNADGRLIGIKDGTGTSSVSVNQLGEITETKDGHGDKVGYAYNLAGQLTQITYPNGKTVKDGYDKAGRLTSASDWLGHTIGFSYTPSSQPETISFPEASGESDHYTYNRSGQASEAKMLKGSETLAQIAYQRDHAGQVSKETQTGLPGAETIEDGYTVDEQLEKAGSASYEYDPAGNPTSNAGAAGTFNAADELTKAASTTYTYNEDGQRTKATPETGPASTYGWNQAGALISINRPEEGSTPKIEDTYTYNGNDLRASETINGSTSYLTWQTTGSLPLLLSDGTTSYILGPEGEPVEQINSKEEATYLHHDQSGSTRLLTNEKGETVGSYSYGPYGETSGHTGTATTALGYDGQLTSPDTGLIYLRNRVYDPATAQFLSVDPAVEMTRQPYTYADDNPTTKTDRSGFSAEEIEVYCPWCGASLPGPVTEAIAESIEKGAEALASLATEQTNGDEGEEGLREAEAEAQEAACKLVELGKEGKTKGKLPSYPPSDWTQEELEQAAQDLRDSIARRTGQREELGDDPGHTNRLREEQQLLRRIDKKLGKS